LAAVIKIFDKLYFIYTLRLTLYALRVLSDSGVFMTKEMIFNCTEHETRVAVLENGALTNIYIERMTSDGIIGNIYKGLVVRVLPGIQAAFVDIGLERTAFLYVTDILNAFSEMEYLVQNEDEEGDDDLTELRGRLFKRENSNNIEDILKEGQEILVQVAKEPIGSKGARLTTHLSLPGRNLVYMPTLNHVGISRRIQDEAERRRLKDVIDALRPDRHGIIARTVSEGKREEELKADLDYLKRLWENIQVKKDRVGAPGLVHRELNLALRAIRDYYTKDFSRIVVDAKEIYQSIRDFMTTFLPNVPYYIELYDRKEPIFNTFGIEMEINRALNKKVWLKSGGYIVIETTEALCAIDVNTGKYVGKRNLEETILNTNLEAAKEIAYQLRLRNIGGIIIIDFIDMINEAHRERVFRTLKDEMDKDRSRTNILKISELGLVEMTRQRQGKNLERTLGEPCPYCEGQGTVRSKATICNEIFRKLEREETAGIGGTLCVFAHPDIAGLMLEDEKNTLEQLERRTKRKIIIRPDQGFHQEHYEIVSLQ
jgi:ribonuclease G